MASTQTFDAKQLIGGAWGDAGDGATFDVLDPFTGDLVGRAPAAGAGDTRRAIEAAAAAFPDARHDEVADALIRESGATFGFAMFQLHFVPGLFRQAAGAAYLPTGQVIPSDIPGAMAMGVRRPVGVVGAIAPWNAALILSARSITAPLVFGNT